MKSEDRIIRASLFAGVTEIIVGIIMYATDLGHFWFERAGFFGVMGVCMVFYGCWHWYLKKKAGEIRD